PNGHGDPANEIAFKAKDFLENTIDEGRWHDVIAVFLQAKRLLEQPHRGDEGKQQCVEIADAHWLETGTAQSCVKLASGIAAEMMMGHIMLAPEPWQGRNCHHQ